MDSSILFRKNKYEVLSNMPTIRRTLFLELKYEDEDYELWLSVRNREDGAEFDHEVEVRRKLKSGETEVALRYEPEKE